MYLTNCKFKNNKLVNCFFEFYKVDNPYIKFKNFWQTIHEIKCQKIKTNAKTDIFFLKYRKDENEMTIALYKKIDNKLYRIRYFDYLTIKKSCKFLNFSYGELAVTHEKSTKQYFIPYLQCYNYSQNFRECSTSKPIFKVLTEEYFFMRCFNSKSFFKFFVLWFFYFYQSFISF